MGVVEKIRGLFGGKESKDDVDGGEEVKYVLWFHPANGGKRRRITEFDYLPSFEEIESNYVRSAGTYTLQEVRYRGSFQQFGRVVWTQMYRYEDDVVEEVVEETKRRRRGRSGGDLVEFLDELKKIADKLDEVGDVGVRLARLAGKSVITLPEGKTVEDFMVDTLDQLQKRWEKLDQLFGKSRVKGDEAEIPVDGKIPAWMVYAPQLMERVMDNVERRLKNWGVIVQEEGKREVPEFPRLR